MRTFHSTESKMTGIDIASWIIGQNLRPYFDNEARRSSVTRKCCSLHPSVPITPNKPRFHDPFPYSCLPDISSFPPHLMHTRSLHVPFFSFPVLLALSCPYSSFSVYARPFLAAFVGFQFWRAGTTDCTVFRLSFVRTEPCTLLASAITGSPSCSLFGFPFHRARCRSLT